MIRVLTLCLVAMAAACGSRSLNSGDGGGLSGAGGGQAPSGAGGGTQPSERVIHIPAGANRDIDVVFVIDNSASTFDLQQMLVAGFPGFTRGLVAPTGALPNLHLAVVSTDLGAGAYDVDVISSCRHGGDQGIFENTPRGTTCAMGALAPQEHFISNINGQANYKGTLDDAFGCIAPLGDTGCGFEHPMGTLLRALGADGNGGPPFENANFLRPNALLAVVIVTNEDDCSAPINSTFFDPASRHVSDPLGPLSSFRCNEYGHLCGGKRPSRTQPADLSGTCHSAEDGRLLRVADVAAALRALKPLSPEKVVLSVIAALPSPYKTELTAPTLADDPAQWPAIVHSCNQSNTWGDPAVRLSDLAQAFGSNGLFESMCVPSFAPALQRTAEKVMQAATPPCLGDKVVDADPGTPTLEPDCTAVAYYGDHGDSAPLARCVDTASVPCWELVSDPVRCGDRKRVEFRLAPGSMGSPLTTLTCQICAPNDPRPGCAY